MKWLINAGLLVAVLVFSVACSGDDVDEIREANESASTAELEADVSVFDLEEGDCIGQSLDDGNLESVELVPCSNARAQHRVKSNLITEEPDGTYPGVDIFEVEANRRCPEGFAFFLYPTAESWEEGDRVINCLEAME